MKRRGFAGGARRRAASLIGCGAFIHAGSALSRGPFVFAFDSMQAFYEAAGNAFPRSKIARYRDFAGCSIYEAEKRRYCWQEGLEALNKLPELSAPVKRSARARRWSENDGDSMDVARFEDGRAFLCQRYRPRVGLKSGGRALLVRVSIGELQNVPASYMLWKTFAAARLVDQLEAAGVRCGIEIHSRCKRNDGSIYQLSITLKRPEMPLNLAGMVAACSPWVLRYWVFCHRVRVGFVNWDDDNGMGYSQKLLPDPRSETIDTGCCLSRLAADEWIKGAAERAGVVGVE